MYFSLQTTLDMAEGRDDLETDPLEEVITCKICFLLMEEAQILLPCMHSFCTICISRLERSRLQGKLTIKCPICREDILEENIHKNRTMAQLMEIVKAKKDKNEGQGSEDICMQCESNNVAFKCANCDAMLCNNCKTIHSKFPKCKDKVLLLEEAEAFNIKQVIIYCSKHPRKAIKMNCEKCNIAICSECKFKDHDTHKSESVESALQNYRGKVNKALNSIKQKISTTKTQMTSVKQQIEQVKLNQIQVKDQVIKRCDHLISDINQERTSLCSELDIQSGAQIKQLELQLESLEHTLTCDESIQSWTQAVVNNTDGSGLLIELQSGLMKKIQQIQQQQTASQDLPRSSQLYKFRSTTLHQLPSSLLGQLVQITNENEFVMSQPDDLVIIQNYRTTSTNLTSLVKKKACQEQVIDVGEFAGRMCLFQSKLYIPCCNIHTIKVYSDTGELVKTSTSQYIFYPNSLCPLNRDRVVLASGSGIFILNSNTLEVTSMLMSGNFNEVHVEDGTIAALQPYENKVYLWNVNNLSRASVLKQFAITVNESTIYNTLSLFNNYVYLADGNSNFIYRYDLKSDQIQKYSGGNSGELKGPRLCVTDKSGNFLLVGFHNDRLQVMSNFKQLSVSLDLQLKQPLDAVVDDNTLYVLGNGKIMVFKLQLRHDNLNKTT